MFESNENNLLKFESHYSLLYAWYMGHQNVLSSKVKKIDTKEIVIDLMIKSPFRNIQEKQIVKQLNAPNVNSAQIQINKLKSNLNYVTWPGLSGNLIIILYLILLICAFDHTVHINRLYPIDSIRDFLIENIFKNPRNALFALQLVIGSHIIEAIYVWALLYHMNFNIYEFSSWIVLDVLLGYPITMRAMQLNQIYFKETTKKIEENCNKDL